MKKIFVVDDEPHVARVIRLYLNNAGYEVMYSNDSEESVGLVGDFLPDLIITDVKMPRLSGIELINKLRETEVLSAIPVIMMTSCLSQEYMKWAEDNRNVHFVGKPVSPSELLEIVNQKFYDGDARLAQASV